MTMRVGSGSCTAAAEKIRMKRGKTNVNNTKINRTTAERTVRG